MMAASCPFSTGLPGLDHVIKGLMPGDNVVWRVDSIDDYLVFARPYCETARIQERKLVYFRFAKHAALLSEGAGAAIYEVHPEAGFETFIGEIHRVIKETGRGALYVFDCLSDLAADWYSDQMLGNFFMLTCPYLYDRETIACFAILRNCHSSHATSSIAETTQLFLDVYRHRGKLYVRPLKVQRRHSPTMFMLHVWEGNDFLPVTDSVTISEVLTSVPWSGVESATPQLDIWDRMFLRAEEILEGLQSGGSSSEDAEEIFHRLLRMMLSRDERVLPLVEKYLSLSDLVEIGKRMIGTGLIGGKSVGMLLARAILKQNDKRWNELLEVHDSFFIGSDVFYTFLVQNGCWWFRQEQRDPVVVLDGAERARRRIFTGVFPKYIVKQFADMLDYFGQSPIIVRSSSLLEDNFGNSFAGKYESVFCANQGSRDERLADFMSAVRTIYASTMSEAAITYRSQRGLLDRDEQMALLVQRVSGSLYGSFFYPQIAGVGFSFNPYVWGEYIKPEAGMVRLVFGLGTRAVNRSDDDYTRVVALNAPTRRPESRVDATRQYAQRKVDLLDLEANQLVSKGFEEVVKRSSGLAVDMFASLEKDAKSPNGRGDGRDSHRWILTFEKLLSETPFINDMREMLKILHEAYDYPVDSEFTANFLGDGSYRINLVQCRPLQVKGGSAITDLPAVIERKNLILQAHGPVIGHSRIEVIDRLIYVAPSIYGQLPLKDRYSIARLIGNVTHVDSPGSGKTIMLLGPGRWGTTTPSLGVPVSFAEINTISILCEIVAMRDGLVPDVSLGTHFFSELIEMDMLYLGLFPGREGNFLDESFFEKAPNKLSELIPSAAGWSSAVRLIDMADIAPSSVLRLHANTLDQQVVCYLEPHEK